MAEGDISFLAPTGATFTVPGFESNDKMIVRGDDYSAEDDRALEWSNTTGSWPADLTGATITFAAVPIAGDVLTLAGEVVVPTGDDQLVRVELAATDTADLEPGTYRYDVQAELDGRKLTLARGRLTIDEDEAT